MPDTPVGFERWEPGSPWGDVVFADGSRHSVEDPDGTIEAEAKQYGARYNAQPKPPSDPRSEPPLTGAAGPPLAPSTPAPPVMPATQPLTPEERAPLTAAPELAELEQGLASMPRQMPSAEQSTTARVLAENGIDPGSLKPKAPAGGASTAGVSPALAAVQAHAPSLIPGRAAAGYEGPDTETRGAVQSASDVALGLKNQSIDETIAAKGQGLQDQSAAANAAYFDAFKRQQEQLGANAALTGAKNAAAEKLAKAKETPIADHPDFPDWFVAASIFGSIAGGFNEGFTGGRYKSTTLPMIQELVSGWRETQKYNKGNLISSLETQLGDAGSALTAGEAKLKDALADMAEAQAKTARTVEGSRELQATAKALRAQSIEDWAKTQTTVMGRESQQLQLAPPAPTGTGARNPIEARIRGLGYTPEQYTKGLGGKVREGENSPTIAQAAGATKQIEADIALLSSISAANGGTLPTKGVLNVPQALIPTLSRLGYKPGMAAEQALAIINTYVTQRAKSYGGVITEADRESAIKEMGQSTEGFIGALRRLRETQNNGIRTALSQQFPGAGQEMLNILLDDSASYGGVPEAPSVPFEKQNVEHTSGGSRPMAANPDLRVTPEEQARVDAALAKRREEDERKRKEREAEVARRRERPIPGSKF